MRIYKDYVEELRKAKLLKGTLTQAIKHWTASFICHLFDTHDFKNILEIGRCDGHSLGLLRWLAPYASITSIDPKPRPHAVKVVEHFQVEAGRAVHFIDMKSSEAFRDGLVKEGPFDFVLIDGDHSYAATNNDWVESCKLATDNAVVVFDNIGEHTGAGQFFRENMNIYRSRRPMDVGFYHNDVGEFGVVFR